MEPNEFASFGSNQDASVDAFFSKNILLLDQSQIPRLSKQSVFSTAMRMNFN